MTAPTADRLDAEIVAYERLRERLETDHLGRWVVFHDGKAVGFFDTFEEADRESSARFDRQPCLIRKIGAGPRVLPTSLWPRMSYDGSRGSVRISATHGNARSG